MSLALVDIFKTTIELSSQEGREFYRFIKKTIGYRPKSIRLFRRALTHSSATAGSNGNKPDITEHNERLEFLGDAIIEMLVSVILHEKFEDYDEGALSQMRANLVCRAKLNKVAFELGLEEHIFVQTKKDIFKSHIPGDAVEALVAAIYLDGGLKRADKFVREHIANDSKIQQSTISTDNRNYKSELLMLFDGKTEEITFDTHKLTTPTHDEEGNAVNFTSKVMKDSIIVGVGYGHTKKMAEQRAAKSALTQLTTTTEEKHEEAQQQ